MTTNRLSAIPLLLLLGVQGCTTPYPAQRPPPVVEAGEPAPAGPATPALPGSTPPPARAPAAAPTSPAVIALLGQAEHDANAGNLEAAAAGLERAIRIEPRNPLLWYHLATVRLAQQEPALAEQLAVKSNSLAAGNHIQQSRNWRLIAEARRALGDRSGAQAAERRVRELETR